MYHAISDLINRAGNQLGHMIAVCTDVFCEMVSDTFGMCTIPATGMLLNDRSHPMVQFAADSQDSKKAAEAASSKQPETGSKKKNSLQDKVNNILSVAEEDEEDAELLEELSKPKKKFFGLFG